VGSGAAIGAIPPFFFPIYPQREGQHRREEDCDKAKQQCRKQPKVSQKLHSIMAPAAHRKSSG
jgi:hypothetical protein